MTCPKCNAEMEEGFLAGQRLAVWIEGPPQKSFWLGVNVRGRERRTIRTFRCTKCGFLESYAN
ncbi:MAG: PF20097 family protein [Acidobacteriia bacterium]|nr:PF20097 family protein [Terriglobia bacterium]